MKTRIALMLIAITLSPLLFANKDTLPNFIEAMIQSIESAPVSVSPLYMERYLYRGKRFYYVPAPNICCDLASNIYEENGNKLCSPSGGITGAGDGKCPEMLGVEKEVIWRDTRVDK